MTNDETRKFIDSNLTFYKSKRRKKIIKNFIKYGIVPVAGYGTLIVLGKNDPSVYQVYGYLSGPLIILTDGIIYGAEAVYKLTKGKFEPNYKEAIEVLKYVGYLLDNNINSFDSYTIEEANNKLQLTLNK